jgi:hypothetical protein
VRFMMIVKATKDSEAGVMPSEELLAAMGKYNEELVNAGVLLAGEGLHPSTRARASGSPARDGPWSRGRLPTPSI